MTSSVLRLDEFAMNTILHPKICRGEKNHEYQRTTDFYRATLAQANAATDIALADGRFHPAILEETTSVLHRGARDLWGYLHDEPGAAYLYCPQSPGAGTACVDRQCPQLQQRQRLLE